jgi:CBS domain containing-hemolysin-like protein
VWEAAGALPLHDFEELVGMTLQEEDLTTLSGWVTHKLGGFPKPGDQLTAGNFHLQVEDMEGMLVARLKITRQEQENP